MLMTCIWRFLKPSPFPSFRQATKASNFSTGLFEIQNKEVQNKETFMRVSKRGGDTYRPT